MIQFNERGLIPAIVQDVESGRVLMHAYLNEEALRRTIDGPDVWFYSRSRRELWHKGETSGNYLTVVQIQHDCDTDSLLVQVNPSGPACHTGYDSCFDAGSLNLESLDNNNAIIHRGPEVLTELLEVIRRRAVEKPEGSYTAELLQRGTGRVAQKVVEEAGEVAIASVSQPGDELAHEMADLLYHMMVLLECVDVPARKVWDILAERRR